MEGRRELTYIYGGHVKLRHILKEVLSRIKLIFGYPIREGPEVILLGLRDLKGKVC